MQQTLDVQLAVLSMKYGILFDAQHGTPHIRRVCCIIGPTIPAVPSGTQRVWQVACSVQYLLWCHFSEVSINPSAGPYSTV